METLRTSVHALPIVPVQVPLVCLQHVLTLNKVEQHVLTLDKVELDGLGIGLKGALAFPETHDGVQFILWNQRKLLGDPLVDRLKQRRKEDPRVGSPDTLSWALPVELGELYRQHRPSAWACVGFGGDQGE